MSTLMTSPEDRHIAESVGSSSVAEIVGGIAAIVLAVLGLANVNPTLMLPIATIAIGVAFLFEGGSIVAEYTDVISKSTETGAQVMEVGSGMTAEVVAGIAGIVLGILALLGLTSIILVASALIVYGTALALSSGMMSRLNDLKIEVSGANATAQKFAHEAVSATMGTQVLVGLAAGVLGILALIGIAPTVLVLVGLLAIGVSQILSGSAVGTRLISMFRR
jgi:hypothetical protein